MARSTHRRTVGVGRALALGVLLLAALLGTRSGLAGEPPKVDTPFVIFVEQYRAATAKSDAKEQLRLLN